VHKTAQEIIAEINTLLAAPQAVQLNTVLEKLLSLAEAVAVLEQNLPECEEAITQDIF
jgi:hypothetical protein